MPSTILIIEDEIFIAADMEDVILELGHKSAGIADDMKSALAIASEDVDIALVDVNLSDGATGPIIAEKLASDFGIEIVFVTANPNQINVARTEAVGALEKPVDVSSLKEVLDYVIALRQGEKPEPPPRLRLFEN
ncbi:response regulator [Aurantiacibacter marinus]|uniref:Response regulatory domain-containing protein n=1 Tax=Aurantiacibacter marinus TaxID=874156 RepID=A0A0H0XQZ9_9SPHN|nr:response regulator [Aurantiacibacter marinus]KLI65033.1 hypothetical protein AAV99_06095 [Aurantiacibacter marinus]